MFDSNALASNYDPSPIIQLLASLGGGDGGETGLSTSPGVQTPYSDIIGGNGVRGGGGMAGDEESNSLEGGMFAGAVGKKGSPLNPQTLAMMQAMMPKLPQPMFAPVGHLNTNPRDIKLSVPGSTVPTLAQLIGGR